MFSEFSGLVAQLKATDPTFAALFDKHTALDEKVRRMETHAEPGTHEEIEVLKKEKLLIKDHVYVMLKKAGLPKA